jgi:hypothetical protein
MLYFQSVSEDWQITILKKIHNANQIEIEQNKEIKESLVNVTNVSTKDIKWESFYGFIPKNKIVKMTEEEWVAAENNLKPKYTPGKGISFYIAKEISDEEIEMLAWENPCLSRQDVYELFDEVFKNKTVQGIFKISVSKEVRQFKERLRQLAKEKYREQLKNK